MSVDWHEAEFIVRRLASRDCLRRELDVPHPQYGVPSLWK
jgi:hypothetical protein